MRKSIDITNEQTILKIETLQRDLSLSAPKIIDNALNSYIMELTKNKEMERISEVEKTINAYITAPIKESRMVVTREVREV